ncbi:MAG: hypothetical protein E6Q68_08445 [Polynucleobacter sp.]|nr:MAG: hypothetical protein E6Q68_08445 [Polynucleobacter sp.]
MKSNLFAAIIIVGLLFIYFKPTQCNESPKRKPKLQHIDVTATYYTDGEINACGSKPEFGQIALSRDISNGFNCGDTVLVICENCPFSGQYIYSDKTHKRKLKTVDIYLPLSRFLKIKSGLKKGKWNSKIYYIGNSN